MKKMILILSACLFCLVSCSSPTSGGSSSTITNLNTTSTTTTNPTNTSSETPSNPTNPTNPSNTDEPEVDNTITNEKVMFTYDRTKNCFKRDFRSYTITPYNGADYYYLNINDNVTNISFNSVHVTNRFLYEYSKSIKPIFNSNTVTITNTQYGITESVEIKIENNTVCVYLNKLNQSNADKFNIYIKRNPQDGLHIDSKWEPASYNYVGENETIVEIPMSKTDSERTEFELQCSNIQIGTNGISFNYGENSLNMMYIDYNPYNLATNTNNTNRYYFRDRVLTNDYINFSNNIRLIIKNDKLIISLLNHNSDYSETIKYRVLLKKDTRGNSSFYISKSL